MEIREFNLEPRLIPMSDLLREHGYEVGGYNTKNRNWRTDGFEITKSGTCSTQPNMVGSTWLCGVIVSAQEGLTLRLREKTPYRNELLDLLKPHMRY